MKFSHSTVTTLSITVSHLSTQALSFSISTPSLCLPLQPFASRQKDASSSASFSSYQQGRIRPFHMTTDESEKENEDAEEVDNVNVEVDDNEDKEGSEDEMTSIAKEWMKQQTMEDESESTISTNEESFSSPLKYVIVGGGRFICIVDR